MRPQHLRSMQLLCLLWAIAFLQQAGALLCYEATASLFRGVNLNNWRWLLMRNMVCKTKEGCEETLVLIETGTKKGVVGFKGCSSGLSYPPQISYLVSPPGVSIAFYSHICRNYLCNNLTTMKPFIHLKTNTPKSVPSFSHTCPSCVGEHSKECLPNFVTRETCPNGTFACYGSTLKFQAGALNTTFLLLGCTAGYDRLLRDFQYIGSIQVTEVLNVLEKSRVFGAGPSSQNSSWSILLGLLLVFRD